MPTLAALAVLVAAYATLTRASLTWLGVALANPTARGNLVVLALLGAVGVRELWVRRSAQSPSGVSMAHAPLVVVAASAMAYVTARWFFPWNRLHAVITLVGGYGLVGCFLTPGTWRRSLAVLALVIVALPFGEQLDVLVGYPLRLGSTHVARNVLAHLGARGASDATLLVFDRGAAQIDVPCSGVKSLWAGGLLALAAPLVMRKTFGVRWLTASLAFALALCLGNTLRIVLLVLLAGPARQATLAQLVHRPLGCVAFIAAAIVYVTALRRTAEVSFDNGAHNVARVPAWLTLAVASALAAVVPLTPASAATDILDESPFVSLPFESEPVQLSPQERGFFTRQGAERASKTRFDWHGVRGSLILVRSANASAQHPPEQCLTASGHTITSARTVILDSSLSVRVLELGHGSAVSWFQSGYATHGDYAARVWASGTWVQVSILFDDARADRVPSDLIHALYRSIAKTYQGDHDA